MFFFKRCVVQTDFLSTNFFKNLKLDIGFYILFTFSIISYFIFVLGAGTRHPVAQNTHFLPTLASNVKLR